MGNLYQKSDDSRVIGIDLLKILAMLMMVALHIIGNFGIIGNLNSFTYKIGAVLYLPTRCAVNCYEIASGFLLINKKYKISRIVYIWLQTFIYSFIIAVAFKIFIPNSIAWREVVAFVFPVLSFKYWYISAYFGLFLFIPLLNYGIKNLTKKQFQIVLFTILSIVFVSAIINRILFYADPFALHNGMSCIWLILMYIVGAYIKLYGVELKFSSKILILIFLFTNAINFAIYFIFAAYGKNYSFILYYDFPTVYIASFSLFLIFAKFKPTVKNNVLNKIIISCSAATLGVYLIHAHPLIYEHLLVKLNFIIQRNNVVFLLLLISAVIGVYVVCSVIDIVRAYVFKLIKIDKMCKLFDKCLGDNTNDFIG